MDKQTVIVLGSGFGAFGFLKRADSRRVNVTIVSPRNHFLFSPLLPSTTVGTVEFRSIIEPVRTARQDIQYVQARCTAVLPDKRSIVCESVLENHSFVLSYDILVIAVGVASGTHGVPGVTEHALFLKELTDARAIRQRIIGCYERAAEPGLTDEERSRLLHTVVVGGGPTGVEVAAELRDFSSRELRRTFPGLVDQARITLLEASPQLLGTFDAVLGDYAKRHFLHEGIDVRTGMQVTEVGARMLTLQDGTVLPFGMLVWSTGTAPTPLVSTLSFARDRAGRLFVDPWLRVDGTENICAIGDCAAFRVQPLPATAQVAQQEGAYLARAITSPQPVRPFRYRHYGMLAYIGGNEAVADLATLKGRGFGTWIFWRSAYLTKLVSTKNKVLVLFDWFKAFVFGRDVSSF